VRVQRQVSGYPITDASHNNIYQIGGEAYFQRLTALATGLSYEH
jgi:hypothetical protein